MTTDTLHNYDRLVDTGVSDAQGRLIAESPATSGPTSPDVTRGLELILRRSDGGGEQDLKAMGGPRHLSGNHIVAPYTRMTA